MATPAPAVRPDAIGADGRRRATAAARRHLTQLWTEAADALAADGVGSQGIALACVGSLARAELGPASDLDLIVLHRGAEPAVQALADKIWYPLWDSGIHLDHSVRTPAQCRDIAGRDLTAAVALLDLAYLAGDEALVTAVRSDTAADWRRHARTRLPELTEALVTRHARHGDLAQLIDPDLKDARGGLRDMGIVRALAAAWLADRPHGEVDLAYARLLDVRDALQTVTGRSRTRLGREDHDAVAALLQVGSGDELLSQVLAAGRVIGYALDGTLRRARQSRQARALRIAPRRARLTSVGHGLAVHEDEIVLGPGVDPGASALLPLQAGVAAASRGLVVSATTLANLAAQAPPLPVPWPAPAREAFADLLGCGPALVPVWEGLDLHGFVGQWIPAWNQVRSRPQRSPVHRHTVDRHTIEAVAAAAGLVREVRRPDLLLLATLLHDLGKLPDAGDHSRAGVPIAHEVMRATGYPPDEVDLVGRLVAEHLTLAELATHRDVADPATVEALLVAVGRDEQTLLLLRALTEADATSVGPAAWSRWRAGLVDRLTASAIRQVRTESAGRVCQLTPDTAGGAEARAALAAARASGLTQVEVSPVEEGFAVWVAEPDRPGLFADVAGWFAAHGYQVRSAAIGTPEDIAVDAWLVGSPHGDGLRAQDLARDLRRLAQGDRAPLRRLARRSAATGSDVAGAAGDPATGDRNGGEGRRRAGVAGHGPSRVVPVPEASATATVVEVRAGDRPGLLHDLGQVLVGAGVRLRSAHVATYAGHAVDTLYVTDPHGRPLSPQDAASLTERLRLAADET